MSALSDLKAAIAAALNTIPSPGQVVTFPGSMLDSEGDGDADEFYTVVLRNGTTEERRSLGACGKSSRVYRIEIHLHLPWDETAGANREMVFDERMEAISDMFRDPAVLAGACDMFQPLSWEDDVPGFREIRGGTMGRYRKAVLDCTVSKAKGS